MMAWLPYVAGVLMMFVTIQLGLWQTRRADEKIALGQRLEAAAAAAPVAGADIGRTAEWTRVALHGRWLADKTVLIDNRVHEGRAGYYVLTPLRTDAGQVVLVRRGWVPVGRDRSRLPEVTTPSGSVAIVGQVRIPEPKPFSLADAAGAGRLWQYLDLAAYAKAFQVAPADRIVEQTSVADDGLVRDWPRPDLGVDRHRGYAVQWFGLAALAAGLCAWFGWKRWREHVSR
ncbi:SURF1 family protein [Nitrogeniibacter mangrovi]|uniref:SURF1-like protein n=1 Tax=Nitrogeniibacter mangrovi TaxID=2016596 RepID=A0A6C1B2M9_9RHOO|nr:SURF1 family protein [Nitrogeniibacter mangrovi]QID17088.1 SURF1 family protein [Nitrogeniibacter mangrovi]